MTKQIPSIERMLEMSVRELKRGNYNRSIIYIKALRPYYEIKISCLNADKDQHPNIFSSIENYKRRAEDYLDRLNSHTQGCSCGHQDPPPESPLISDFISINIERSMSKIFGYKYPEGREEQVLQFYDDLLSVLYVPDKDMNSTNNFSCSIVVAKARLLGKMGRHEDADRCRYKESSRTPGSDTLALSYRALLRTEVVGSVLYRAEEKGKLSPEELELLRKGLVERDLMPINDQSQQQPV